MDGTTKAYITKDSFYRDPPAEVTRYALPQILDVIHGGSSQKYREMHNRR